MVSKIVPIKDARLANQFKQACANMPELKGKKKASSFKDKLRKAMEEE